MLLKEGNKNIDEISMREEWYGRQFMCGLTIGGFGELLKGVVRIGNEDFVYCGGRPIPLCVLWW